jgi:hypothetical protein
VLVPCGGTESEEPDEEEAPTCCVVLSAVVSSLSVLFGLGCFF